MNGEASRSWSCNDYTAGGGAGGSIWLIADNLTGEGYVQSNGGSGGDCSNAEGGGGAGGRIAAWYNTSTFTGIDSSTVSGGARGGTRAADGSVGSMIFYDVDDNSVILNEGFKFQDIFGCH